MKCRYKGPKAYESRPLFLVYFTRFSWRTNSVSFLIPRIVADICLLSVSSFLRHSCTPATASNTTARLSTHYSRPGSLKQAIDPTTTEPSSLWVIGVIGLWKMSHSSSSRRIKRESSSLAESCSCGTTTRCQWKRQWMKQGSNRWQ